jgi:5-methylcytosine-specific restriction endonuclease McrA
MVSQNRQEAASHLLNAIEVGVRSSASQAGIANIHMSNRYGIPEEDEKEIRARDKACVFCRVSMKRPSRAKRASEATIEHFNNDGPLRKKYNLAICCRSCNSSKGTRKLLAWFETPYL